MKEKRNGHCRVCGAEFKLWLVLDDACTACLHKQVEKMRDCREEGIKAERGRVCAPLGPVGLIPIPHRIHTDL